MLQQAYPSIWICCIQSLFQTWKYTTTANCKQLVPTVGDEVPHRSLMKELEDIDLDHLLLRWILSGRTQKAVVNGVTSNSLPVFGLPWWYPIFLSLSRDRHLTLFADDMLLYGPISHQNDFRLLQQDVNNISDWVDCNSMCKMYVNACAEYIKLNPLPRPSHNCTYVGSCLRECLPTSTSLSDPGLNAKNLCTKTPWSYILQPRKPLPNAHLPSLSQSGVHKSSMESI